MLLSVQLSVADLAFPQFLLLCSTFPQFTVPWDSLQFQLSIAVMAPQTWIRRGRRNGVCASHTVDTPEATSKANTNKHRNGHRHGHLQKVLENIT